jgi:hypothetical protein
MTSAKPNGPRGERGPGMWLTLAKLQARSAYEPRLSELMPRHNAT